MIQEASERRWRLLPWRLLVHDNLPIITHTHTKEATRTSSMLEQAISKERKIRVFVRFNNGIRQCDTSVGLGLCVDSHRCRLLVLSKGYFRNPLWRQSTHSSLTTLVAL
ncbi:hypothetical protein YC2023_043026 [Brassica napus]